MTDHLVDDRAVDLLHPAEIETATETRRGSEWSLAARNPNVSHVEETLEVRTRNASHVDLVAETRRTRTDLLARKTERITKKRRGGVTD